ncbi:Ankyrin repeat-containing protein [Spironucleus salmonicida]|uniref:Ankyrin repeat-containing protein n=1 Tax=Spironucleus salmonicida TaxID=348837 RepID=V6LNB1_9EUKA|nr:Ankyrin repeat-containing protein [Spironucleus salmonicida]|eukprot:EST45201.1 Ankyrin repeat-containing protein [Spironucleus salmonicida]
MNDDFIEDFSDSISQDSNDESFYDQDQYASISDELDYNIVSKYFRLFAHQNGNQLYCYGKNSAFRITEQFHILEQAAVDFPYYCTQYCEGFQIKKQPHYYEIVNYKDMVLAHIGSCIYHLNKLTVSIFYNIQDYDQELPHNRLCVYKNNLYFCNNGTIKQFVNNQFQTVQYVSKEARLYVYNDNFIVREQSKQFRLYQNKTAIFLQAENIWFDSHRNGIFIFYDASSKVYFILDLRCQITAYSFTNGFLIDPEINFNNGKWEFSQLYFNRITSLQEINQKPSFIENINPRPIIQYPSYLEFFNTPIVINSDISTILFNGLTLAQIGYQNGSLTPLKQILSEQQLQLLVNKNFCEYAVQYNINNIAVLFGFNLSAESIEQILPILIVNNALSYDVLLRIPVVHSINIILANFDSYNDDFVSLYSKLLLQHPNYRALLTEIIQNQNIYLLKVIYPKSLNDVYYEYEDSPAELCISSTFYEGLSYILSLEKQPIYSTGETLLMKALELEDFYAVQMCISQVQINDKQGNNPLFYCNQLAHVKYLYEYIITHQNNDGKTSLMMAIEDENAEIALFLSKLEYGFQDNSGNCALIYAICRSQWSIVKNLLDKESHLVSLSQLLKIQTQQSLLDNLIKQLFTKVRLQEQILPVCIQFTDFDDFCDQFGRTRYLFQYLNRIQDNKKVEDIFQRAQDHYLDILKIFTKRFN